MIDVGLHLIFVYIRPHSFDLGTVAVDHTVLMQVTLAPKQGKRHTHSQQLLKQDVTMTPQQSFAICYESMSRTRSSG